ncbi:TonB-dependent receptor [Butyricimonas hominis]|uniref:TonB-dependent receptor n=1 Tax=Butyricimonas hominis TaxID=2763032 RepID=UPI00351899B4
MKKILFIIVIHVFSVFASFAQKNFTLSGYVENKMTGERLVNATIHETRSGRGTTCNQYGFFSLSLPRGQHHLSVSHVGFARMEINLELKNDTLVVIFLSPENRLEEVEVVERKRSFSSALGKHSLSLDWVKRMPAVLGEADVLKSLHFLPGVNSGQEGLTGFSVRGGSTDNTQFLLDGLPVYNVNHAYGYFSAFNGDALQDVTLYTGELPARYGGSLSSVLEVTMREGNRKKYSGNIRISPVAGSVIVEGPIKKDKASFIISGRRTWLDGLLWLGQRVAGSDFSTGYNFYDLNAKVNWEVNKYNRLYISMYNSRDFRFAEWKTDGSKHADRFQFYWGNTSVSGRWNHLFAPSFFSNITLYYSQFSNSQKMTMYNENFARREGSRTDSRLRDWTLKTDFEYLPGAKHHFRFGSVSSIKYFAPEMSYIGSVNLNEHVKDTTTGNVYSQEAYIEDHVQLGYRWAMDAGIRFSLHAVSGTRYYAWQPRLSLSYRAGKNMLFKASWARMQQPLHLLINTSVGMNTDLWVPVTRKIAPASSDLFSVGWSYSFANSWNFSIEGYFHNLKNVVRYQDGIRFLKNKDNSWQEYVDVGKGRAYGIDFMVKKTSGLLTGWLSYSLSKSERSFTGINAGNWYPFEYDRGHKLNVTANYALPLKEKSRFYKSFSLNFTLATGNYISLGKQLYNAVPMPEAHLSGESTPEYREYIEHPNNFRMPAYHHLDVSYVLDNRKGRGSSWVFGIYNIYARKNPSVIYHKPTAEGITTRCWSLLPFVPSVTWSYKF